MGILQHLIDEKKGIRENVEEQYFEFYVAGYTKKWGQIPLQPNHALLFSDAWAVHKRPGVQMEAEYTFPFGYQEPVSNVELRPEPTNKYDKNALLVVVHHPSNIEEYLEGTNLNTHELVLGYVPASISRIVRYSLDKIKPGWVKRVRQVHNKKHYSTKVAIPWVPGPNEEDLLMLEGLASLIEIEE